MKTFIATVDGLRAADRPRPQPRPTEILVCTRAIGVNRIDLHALTMPADQVVGMEWSGDVVEVGCWAHCRRYFFEAAVCKYAVGVEGLRRIRDLYHLDQTFKDRPPSERQRLRAGGRNHIVRPSQLNQPEVVSGGRLLALDLIGNRRRFVSGLAHVRCPLSTKSSGIGLQQRWAVDRSDGGDALEPRSIGKLHTK